MFRVPVKYNFTFDTALFDFQDGHFENTYYSDFISSLARIKYAGELALHHTGVEGARLSFLLNPGV